MLHWGKGSFEHWAVEKGVFAYIDLRKKFNGVMNFSKVFLATALVALGLSSGSLSAQLMRGEAVSTEQVNNAEVARQLELELIVGEMEDAGYELDVEEGFEEEWEEEIWVAAEDDLEAVLIAPEDPEIIEDIYVADIEEEEEEWLDELETEILEVPDQIIEEIGYVEESGLSSEDQELVVWYDEDETEYASLVADSYGSYSDEEAIDPGWEEVMDQWELEEMDFEMDYEDIDLLEEIFYAN